MQFYFLKSSEIVYLPQLMIIVLFGCFLIWAGAAKRKLFWPSLIIVTLTTSGLMIFRLSWVDEILTGCLVLGVLIRMFLEDNTRTIDTQKEKPKTSDRLIHFHRWIFFLFVIYMIFQSIRGAIVLESYRKFIWMPFFLTLGLLSIIISQKKFPVPSVRKIALIISSASLAYFSLLIGYGLFTEIFRGIERWYLQTAELGSSAQFMFPIAILMPAFFILAKDKNSFYRRLGWISFITALAAAVYYDSRVSLLTIAAFMIISIVKIGFKKFVFFLILCSSFTFLLVQFSDVYKGDFRYFLENVFSAGDALYKKELSVARDVDRFMYIKIAFVSINGNLEHFFLGYGLRSHSTVIAPYVYQFVSQYYPDRLAEIDEKGKIGTEAFTAFAVDTGIIGLSLLFLNFIFTTFIIFVKKSNPQRFSLLLSVFIVFMWLFVINLQDNTLFYFLIMPNGLLVQLSNYKKTTLLESKEQN